MEENNYKLSIINCQLPKGYKNTEVGVIPEDWNIENLECLSYQIGDGIHTTPKYRTDGDYYFINGNNLSNGKILIFEDTKRVSKDEYLIHKRDLDSSTILLSINGTIGNIAFYSNENIVLGKSAAYIRLNNKIEKQFIFQLVQTEIIQKYFENELTGSTIKNLGLGSIRNTPIPLPPTKAEQTAIATALSDADALINSLSTLIAKKRNIKQGAMQKLLKPNPDSNREGWEVKKLGEIADVLDNLRKPLNDFERQKMKGDIPYCGANGVVGYVDDFVIDDDIILMAEDGGYFDEYKTRPIAYRMKGKCWVNNHAHILKAKKEIDQDFLFYSLVHKNILDFINGGTRAKLNKGELINILVAVSAKKEEQTLIATILSDMDAEIQALETKLEKYRKIKLGMMQNLLTGKIRLV